MSKLILHLGCGNQRFEGCINIDCRKTQAVDKVSNVMVLPFEAGTVDAIVSHHTIEHIPYRLVPQMLEHWCDLLKPGGTIELSFPDTDWLCEMFYKHKITLEKFNHLMLGNTTEMVLMPEQIHRAALTYEFVKGILRHCGIKNIHRITGKTYTQYGVTVKELVVDTKVHSARMLHFKGVKR